MSFSCENEMYMLDVTKLVKENELMLELVYRILENSNVNHISKDTASSSKKKNFNELGDANAKDG